LYDFETILCLLNKAGRINPEVRLLPKVELLYPQILRRYRFLYKVTVNEDLYVAKEDEIATYLTESTLPDVSVEALEALQSALLASSKRSTAEGKPVRYLRSISIPGDGLVIWLFEALDAVGVRNVNEEAKLLFTRTVEVIELVP
jgi:hypothetical protein